MSAEVHLTVDAGVATLTWARDHRRNAMDGPTAAALLQGLRDADADPEVAVAVLAPTGGPFCSGWDVGDLRELGDVSPEALSHRLRDMDALLAHLRLASLPVVARVGGDALGFGLALLARCTVVIASESARFALPEIHLGIPPVMAAVDLLDAVSHRDLTRWAVDGEPRDATEARDIGLVTRVVPDDELDDAVRAAAASIARHPASAVRGTVSAMRELAAVRGHRRRTLGREFAIDVLTSAVARDGMAAFAARGRAAEEPR